MTQTNASTPAPRMGFSFGNASLWLKFGLAVLLGLVLALILAGITIAKGPFRDKANRNVLTAVSGNTDPNAPLYTFTSGAPAPADSQAASGSNEQGSGVSALMGVKTPETTPTDVVVTPVPTPNSASTETAPNASTPALTTTPTPSNPTGATNSAASAGSRYTIQAGSFSDEAAAEAMKSRLAAQGHSVTVSKKMTADGAVYRVRVGSYDSAKAAQEANGKIKGSVLDVSP